VRYDERGCGLSDHDPEELTFETFVQDLEVVVDDLGLDVFPLLGVSQGGPVAVEYARRHPGRVSHLILVGAFVKGRLARADDPDLVASNDLQRDLIRIGWGLDDPSHRLYFSSTFMPDAAPELWSDFAQLLRRTTSAVNALRIFDASAWTDVTTAAAEVTVPTMIVHARDDVRVPYEHALEYATLISRSRLVTLDSRNHLLRPDEPAWGRLLDEIDRFLGDGHTVPTT
jgi:pimeloyl-ACP methyl ester carboxylesterase